MKKSTAIKCIENIYIHFYTPFIIQLSQSNNWIGSKQKEENYMKMLSKVLIQEQCIEL